MSTVEAVGARPASAYREDLAWRQAHTAFASVLLVWLGVYAATLRSLISAWWHSGTYQYCFLIFPIVAWLVWMSRRSTAVLPVRAELWGVAGLAAASVLWLMGALVGVDLLQHFSVVVMLPFAVLACYGRRVAWHLIFPLAYLFFAVPYGDFMVEPLRLFTAHFSVNALQLSGATVFLDGHYIEVPVGTFDVAKACSGVKFFIATTALGTLFAYLFYRTWPRRLIFVAIALIAPIIANGLRVYFTILIGETFGMQYASGTDHLIFGWQFFGTVLVLLFLGGWWWRQDDAPAAAEQPDEARRRLHGWRYPATAVLAFAALAFGPLVQAVTAQAPLAHNPPVHWSPAAAAGGGWHAARAPGDWPPQGTKFVNADAYLNARYLGQGEPISLYIAQYAGQPRDGHDVIQYNNRLSEAAWQVMQTRSSNVAGLHIGEKLLRHGGQRRLLWYWYDIDGSHATGALKVKLLQLWQRLRLSDQRAAVICLSAPIAQTDHDLQRARASLAAFVQANQARISALLSRVDQKRR